MPKAIHRFVVVPPIKISNDILHIITKAIAKYTKTHRNIKIKVSTKLEIQAHA